jgi:hypothetical protein
MFASEFSYLWSNFVAILQHAGLAVDVADKYCKDNSTANIAVWNQRPPSSRSVNCSPFRNAFQKIFVRVACQFSQHDLLPRKPKSFDSNFVWYDWWKDFFPPVSIEFLLICLLAGNISLWLTDMTFSHFVNSLQGIHIHEKFFFKLTSKCRFLVDFKSIV